MVKSLAVSSAFGNLTALVWTVSELFTECSLPIILLHAVGATAGLWEVAKLSRAAAFGVIPGELTVNSTAAGIDVAS